MVALEAATEARAEPEAAYEAAADGIHKSDISINAIQRRVHVTSLLDGVDLSNGIINHDA